MSMSATIVRGPEQHRSQSPALSGPLTPHLIAIASLLVVVVALTTGWFSADEVVMRKQSDALVAGSWTVEFNGDAAELDPDSSFALLARSDRIGNEIAPYTKHPAAPVLFAAGTRLVGASGLYVPGLLSLLATSMLFARRFHWSPVGLWAPVLATTSLFHLSVVWAHLPALVLATGACLASFGGKEPLTTRRAFLASFAVVGVALLRSEGLLLGAALSVGLLFSVPPQPKARVRTILPLLGALTAYVAEPLARELLFGSAASPLNAPIAYSEASSVVGSRLSVLRVMLIEPSITGGLGQARLIGLILLVAGSLAVRRRMLGPNSAKAIVGLAAGMYLVGVFESPIPGLLVAMPALAAALPWISLERRADRGVAVASAAFAGAVILTSYDNAGGGDWGARYLFIGVPLLLLLVIPAIERMRVTTSGATVVVGLVACALVVQVGIVADIIGRGDTVQTVESVRQSIEAEVALDPGLVVAVSDERLSRFLYDQGLRGRSFHVPSEREDEFDRLVGPRRVLWVDLGAQAESRTGQTVATAGSVVIRTEVRR